MELQEWTAPQVTEVNLSGLTASAIRRLRCRNPEKRRQDSNRWNDRYYAGNTEKVLAYKHRPEIRERDSARRTERRDTEPGLRERDREAGNRDRAAHPERILYNAALQRARKYSLEFSIMVADLLPLPTHCPIFRTVLDYGGGKGKGYNPNAASVDQIIPSRGYVKGNIAIMSRRANSIKNDGTADEHIAIAMWMKRVAS
jgi:hypothetical protein